MRLHDIHAGNLMAWCWLRPTWRGRSLGQGKFDHLYPVERGTPPPIQTEEEVQHEPWRANSRRYFRPFSSYHGVDFKNPACGALKTTATYGRLEAWWGNNKCPNCQDIATARDLTTGAIDELQTADPWTRIPYEDRRFTLDPVTGR